MSVVRSEVQSDGTGQLVEAVYTFPGLVPEVVFVPIEPFVGPMHEFAASFEWSSWRLAETFERVAEQVVRAMREAGL